MRRELGELTDLLVKRKAPVWQYVGFKLCDNTEPDNINEVLAGHP